MSSQRRSSQNFASSAIKLKLQPINKILKIDHVKLKKQKKDEIQKQVSRVALADLLRNTPTTQCHELPDFKIFLSNKENIELFREFLKSQFCHENLDFYLACERYRQLDPNRVGTEMVKFMANQIYNDFLSPDARQPVNVDSRCIQLVRTNLKEPKPDLLRDAQMEIFNLMRTDCYPRFCKTWTLDKDTAKKILSESTTIESTPRKSNNIDNVDKNSTATSSTRLATTMDSSSCSSSTRSRSLTSYPKRQISETGKVCPPDCPYDRVGLPCQTHGQSSFQLSAQMRKRKLPAEDREFDEHLDLKRVHRVPILGKVPSSLPPPPPLPPKQDEIFLNNEIMKKSYAYVGKVFHV